MRWTKGVDILEARGKRLPRSQVEFSFENLILNVQNEVWIKIILVWVFFKKKFEKLLKRVTIRWTCMPKIFLNI
jgi:hypothetical protein